MQCNFQHYFFSSHALNDCKFVCKLCSLFENIKSHISGEAMRKKAWSHTSTLSQRECVHERHFKINGFSTQTCDFFRKTQRFFSCLIKQMHLLDGWITRRRKINGHDDFASNDFLYLFKIVIFCCEFIEVGIRLFKAMHRHTCSLHWICCYLRRISYGSCLVQKCFSCWYCQRRLLFCQIYINFNPEKPTHIKWPKRV